MKKVILDVDTGIDDAIAIILAVKSKALDILGITTVCGNVPVSQGAINTKRILKLLGSEKQIPVIRGASKPLIREPYFETNVHGENGLGGTLEDLEVDVSDGVFGPDFIIEKILENKNEVTLIMTAPLTNLALSLQKEPAIVHYVKEAIIMGGAVATYGNVTPTAEYNIFVDPEAARLVFHSGMPITLVGLDVTRKALIDEKVIEKLGEGSIKHFIKKSTECYMERYSRRYGLRGCAMHDPLAVAVALDKKLVTTQKYYVDIETKSQLSDGQTVCDFQRRLNREANIEVCLDLDVSRFLELFINTIRD
ncbi:MAG: nucleoside hydrolase [Bacillota bacterium]